ncbi:unnamed protein product [Prunus brigantina]
MKTVKRVPKLEGKNNENVVQEISSHKKRMLAIDIIFVVQSVELLFVVDLVHGSNLGGKIVVDEKLAVKQKLVAQAEAHHIKIAPLSHDILKKLMKAVKRFSKLEGKNSEKVVQDIASHKKRLLAMDIIFMM